MAGRRARSVTRRRACRALAPSIRAWSSSSGSMAGVRRPQRVAGVGEGEHGEQDDHRHGLRDPQPQQHDVQAHRQRERRQRHRREQDHREQRRTSGQTPAQRPPGPGSEWGGQAGDERARGPWTAPAQRGTCLTGLPPAARAPLLRQGGRPRPAGGTSPQRQGDQGEQEAAREEERRDRRCGAPSANDHDTHRPAPIRRSSGTQARATSSASPVAVRATAAACGREDRSMPENSR